MGRWSRLARRRPSFTPSSPPTLLLAGPSDSPSTWHIGTRRATSTSTPCSTRLFRSWSSTRASTLRCSSCTSSWQPEPSSCFFLSTPWPPGVAQSQAQRRPWHESLLRPVRPTATLISSGSLAQPSLLRRHQAATRPAPDSARASVVRLTLPTLSDYNNNQNNEQDSQSEDNLQIAYHTTYPEDKPADAASVTLRCLNGHPRPLKAKAPKIPLAFPQSNLSFPPPCCGTLCKCLCQAASLLGPNWPKTAPNLTKLTWGPRGVAFFAF